MATDMEMAAPKDLSHLYSRVTKHRVASEMKRFYRYFAIPGIGNLAGGMLALSQHVINIVLRASRSPTSQLLSLRYIGSTGSAP